MEMYGRLILGIEERAERGGKGPGRVQFRRHDPDVGKERGGPGEPTPTRGPGGIQTKIENWLEMATWRMAACGLLSAP